MCYNRGVDTNHLARIRAQGGGKKVKGLGSVRFGGPSKGELGRDVLGEGVHGGVWENGKVDCERGIP